MKRNWKMVKLDDVVSKLGDGLHGTPKYDPNGNYYFINGSNLTNGHISVNENTKKVSEEEYYKYKKELNERTIFVSINGTLGNIATFNNEKVILGKSACYFNVKEGVNKDFIKYVVTDQSFQYYISEYATGSTIKNVPLKAIREYKFNLPDFPTQTAIAEILSSLDDKIELNNKINQELEALAQALFKQWFIDFEFPNESGLPYKSSGGNMVESELGEIPKGWTVEKLGDIAKTTSGGTPSRSKPEYYENGKILWVKSKELNNSMFFDTEEKINDIGLKNSSAKLVPAYSVLIAMYGATVGQFGLITEEATCNQAICAIIPSNALPFSFIYLFFQNYRKEFENLAVGSAQQNISQELIKNTKLITPPSIILKEFHEVVSEILLKIEHNCRENTDISTLRDTILPKLISGELNVQEVLTQNGE